jgi:hypothetical protein
MAPPAPLSLSFTQNTLGQIVLSWFASPGSTGYNLYTRNNIADGFLTPVNPVAITATSFLDPGFVPNSVAYYNVTAIDGTGESLPSSTLMVGQSNSQTVPKVDFHQTKFSKFIEEKGYRMRLDSALACPCNRASMKTTDSSDIDCPLCNNKHYIYTYAGQLPALISNMTQDSNLEQSGQWLNGTYKITTRPQNQLGLYDRLTFLDDSVSFTEAVVRADTGLVDRLKFPAISFDMPIEDLEGVTYVHGTDFSLNSDGNIVWGLSVKFPPPGRAYGVRYQTYRRLIIVDYPHVQRASWLGTPPVYQPMSLASVGKLEFFMD